MMHKLREALMRSDESEIIPSVIYDTVIEAVKRKLIGTQLLALRIGPWGAGDSTTIVTNDKNALTVQTVAEGAEIPESHEAYSSFTLVPVKYGVRPMITREMIEDGKFDVLERNLKEGAYQLARKLDSLILEQIESGSDANTSTHMVSGGTSLTIANICSAMLNLEADDYTPTDMIIGPEPASDIRQLDTFVEADKAGVTNPSQRLIGKIFGMNVWVSNQINNTEYVYIIDRDHALCLAEKRPITMRTYDDVARDVQAVAFSARWAARYLREDACSHIELS
jgi:HK97 family phage major capsid protein